MLLLKALWGQRGGDRRREELTAKGTERPSLGGDGGSCSPWAAESSDDRQPSGPPRVPASGWARPAAADSAERSLTALCPGGRSGGGSGEREQGADLASAELRAPAWGSSCVPPSRAPAADSLVEKRAPQRLSWDSRPPSLPLPLCPDEAPAPSQGTSLLFAEQLPLPSVPPRGALSVEHAPASGRRQPRTP